METVKMPNEVKRLKEGLLRDYAIELLNAGFRLLIYKPNDKRAVTFITFEKNDKLGYVQLDEFGYRLRFSTVHKPSREAGTGYGLHMPFEGTSEPTIADAERAFILKPHWDRSNFIPKKYESLEEYMKKETILKYDLVNGI